MSDFIFLNDNTSIRVSEINRVSLNANGKLVEFYLKGSGYAAKDDLKEPVTLAHVFRMIALSKVSMAGVDQPFIEWDDLSARVSEIEALEAKELNANWTARFVLGVAKTED